MLLFSVLLFTAININLLSAAKPESDCDIFYKLFKTEYNLIVLECKIARPRFFAKYSSRYNQWPLAVEIPNEPTIYLNLKKVESVVTKKTPVYFGNGLPDSPTFYEKSTIQQVFPNLKDVITFQDYDRKAAITIFSYGEDELIMEGFIGNYVLRQTQDKQFFLLKVTYPTIKFKNNEWTKYKKNNNFSNYNLMSSEEEIAVKILVALDWSSAKRKPVQIIRSLVIYYNAANMLFQPFTFPKIQLIVSGIIIPKTEFSTPYFPKKLFRSSNDHYINLNPANENFRKYFRKEEGQVFPKNLFDVIIGMTDLPFCDVDYDCQHYGLSDQSVIYNKGMNAEWNDPIPIVGVVRHPNFQGSYAVIAREIAHILGSSYNTPYYAFKNCNGLMNKFVRPENWPLDWSACNIDDISLYLSFNQSSGFSKKHLRAFNMRKLSSNHQKNNHL